VTGPVEIATEAWGAAMPDWVLALAKACARTSQTRVAKALDRSGGTISQVLHNKYAADTAHIEERVRGVLMQGRVDCPALGELPQHACQDHRARARTYVMGDPTRQAMRRACHKCPRYQKDPADES
jgi:hypothetical protein